MWLFKIHPSKTRFGNLSGDSTHELHESRLDSRFQSSCLLKCHLMALKSRCATFLRFVVASFSFRKLARNMKPWCCFVSPNRCLGFLKRELIIRLLVRYHLSTFPCCVVSSLDMSNVQQVLAKFMGLCRYQCQARYASYLEAVAFLIPSEPSYHWLPQESLNRCGSTRPLSILLPAP